MMNCEVVRMMTSAEREAERLIARAIALGLVIEETGSGVLPLRVQGTGPLVDYADFLFDLTTHRHTVAARLNGRCRIN